MRAASIWIVLLLLAGCRRETVVERAARQYRESQESRIGMVRLEAARFAGMTDLQMVRANQTDGLGLAIRPQKTELHVGESLKLHLVYANLAAPVAVSATTCQGFSLSAEDEVAVESTSMDLTFSCSPQDPLRDNGVALTPGELRSVDMSTADTKLSFDHPGQYIVMVGWRSFRTTTGMFLSGSEYSLLGSNRILITVR